MQNMYLIVLAGWLIYKKTGTLQPLVTCRMIWSFIYNAILLNHHLDS